MNRWLFRGALLLLFALGAVLGWREIASPDLGFHLGTAQWMVEHTAFVSSDLFTYTVPDHPYINLQWLFQLIVYGVYRVGETTALVVLSTLMTLAFTALLVVRTRRREGTVPLSVIPLVLLFFLSSEWELRPHLFSWLLGSAVLLILEEFSRGSRRWLPLLPLIMLIWVNTHSLFILGGVIIGSAVFCELLSAAREKRPPEKRLILWAALAAAACLLNPYHIRGLLFPLTQFHDIQSSSGFNSAVTGVAELISPFDLSGYFKDGHFVLFQPKFFWQIFSILLIPGLLGARKSMRLNEWLLTAAFFYIFMKANKNFGYVVMVVFPIIASGLSPLRFRFKKNRTKLPASGTAAKAGTLCGWIGIMAALIALTWTEHLYALAWSPHRRGTAINAAVTPSSACDFLIRHQIKGRMLNSWADGGYIAWATGNKVFIYSHGEVVGAEFYRSYTESRDSRGFAPILSTWKPEVAVVPFKTIPYWLYSLSRDKAWRMVYADSTTALFLHESASPHVSALPGPQAGVDFVPFDTLEAEALIRRAAAAPLPGFFIWLQGSRAYPSEEIARSSFYLQTAKLDACISVSLAGLQKTDFLVPELLLNLGHALNARRRYDLADLCFDAFLRADDTPLIRQEIHRVRMQRRERNKP